MTSFAFAKGKVFRNASWLIGGKLFNKLIAFVVGILTARYLGPGNYGLINYAAAYTTFFASLCTLGINSVIVKDFADHPDEEGQAIGTTLALRAVSSLLSSVMIIGIVSFMDAGEPITIAVVALCSLGLLFQISDTFNYWFQARLMSRYYVVASSVAYVIVSVYKVALLVLGKSVLWFALATSVEYMVLGGIMLYVYRKNDGPKLSISLLKAKELLSSSKGFILAGLMVAVYASTDKLMLKQMLDVSVVGHYALAVSLSATWAFVLAAIIDSLYPVIVKAHSEDQGVYERKNKQLYAIVFYVSFGASALICLFAEPIVILLYGGDYAPAVASLRVVAWYTAFSYLGIARNAWIVCECRQKYLKYLYAGAALLNVMLNLILIPFWGAVGAALASLITQTSTTFLFPFLIKPLRPNAMLMVDAILLKGVLPDGKF